MTAMIGRREFLGRRRRRGCSPDARSRTGPARRQASGDLARQLQGIAEQMLAEYPQNATILGIAKGKLAPLSAPMAGPDSGRASRPARTAIAQAARRRCAALDLADLSDPDKLNGAVALQAHEMAQEAMRSRSAIRWCSIPTTAFATRPMS